MSLQARIDEATEAVAAVAAFLIANTRPTASDRRNRLLVDLEEAVAALAAKVQERTMMTDDDDE